MDGRNKSLTNFSFCWIGPYAKKIGNHCMQIKKESSLWGTATHSHRCSCLVLHVRESGGRQILLYVEHAITRHVITRKSRCGWKGWGWHLLLPTNPLQYLGQRTFKPAHYADTRLKVTQHSLDLEENIWEARIYLEKWHSSTLSQIHLSIHSANTENEGLNFVWEITGGEASFLPSASCLNSVCDPGNRQAHCRPARRSLWRGAGLCVTSAGSRKTVAQRERKGMDECPSKHKPYKIWKFSPIFL